MQLVMHVLAFVLASGKPCLGVRLHSLGMAKVKLFIKHPHWDRKSCRNWNHMRKLVREHYENEEEKWMQQAENKRWVEAYKKRARKERAERQAQREWERQDRAGQEREDTEERLQGSSLVTEVLVSYC